MFGVVKLFKSAAKAIGRVFKKRRKKAPPIEIEASDEQEYELSNIDQKGRKKARISKSKAVALSPDQALKGFSAIQLSPHTRKAYGRDLNDFVSYLKDKKLFEEWADLGATEIAGYRDYLINEKKFAKNSITRKLAVLKSFYSWSVAEGHIDRNPATTVRSFPQSQDSTTGFLTDEQVDKFLNYLAGIDLSRLSYHLTKICCETLLMLGLRRSEACQILFEDFEYNADNWILKIKGKGGRDRRLPLPELLLSTIETWIRRLFPAEAPPHTLLENPAAWIDFFKRRTKQPLLISTRAIHFSKQLSDSELARIVRKHALKAGIPFRVSPHMLRSTAITHALDQGATHRGIQQMAGWTSPLMITRYDKKRMDPKYSAVHHLKYAHKKTSDPTPSQSS